ncbi:LPXTG cell wall anchor domain-containing protein [Streptomyces sp. NBC_01142]|uniref:LAETG motif-containing sortase-dependent surface protein n=1 Tax=Streptomyces sp. NBC_01142 TaxID=2975865 RepID=UPI00224EEDA1|nr:LAETG motif-containing sortase-dependent surface protein [Streptomyces sp. NBC_01142]MCX4825381.1 LPXTG cell wall anchor domain-containing protein [Streptomyces sp. NBC_01142]
MTVNKRSWRGSGALIAVATAGVFGVGLAAGPALAHTPAWAVTCSDVSVDLTNYSPQAENTVTVTVDGKDLLATETFKGEFHKKLELPKHDKEVTVRLVVKAGDSDGHSRDETKNAPVCQDSTPTPSATPTTPSPSATPSTPTPSATPSDTPSETTSSPAAPSDKPSPTSPPLAETGSSSSTPLIAGAAAVVILAGGGIVWAARKRRTAQS